MALTKRDKRPTDRAKGLAQEISPQGECTVDSRPQIPMFFNDVLTCIYSEFNFHAFSNPPEYYVNGNDDELKLPYLYT